MKGVVAFEYTKRLDPVCRCGTRRSGHGESAPGDGGLTGGQGGGWARLGGSEGSGPNPPMVFTSSVAACLESQRPVTFVFSANSGHSGSQTLTVAKCHRVRQSDDGGKIAFQFEADAAGGYGASAFPFLLPRGAAPAPFGRRPTAGLVAWYAKKRGVHTSDAMRSFVNGTLLP